MLNVSLAKCSLKKDPANLPRRVVGNAQNIFNASPKLVKNIVLAEVVRCAIADNATVQNGAGNRRRLFLAQAVHVCMAVRSRVRVKKKEKRPPTCDHVAGTHATPGSVAIGETNSWGQFQVMRNRLFENVSPRDKKYTSSRIHCCE